MTKSELTAHITAGFSGRLEVLENPQLEPYVIVNPEDLVAFARYLHDDPALQMTFLMNLAGVDTGERFEVVYSVCSYQLKHRLLFKIQLPRDNAEFDSVMQIWPAANWYEREVWELFGMTVRNHPNLTRFLLADDWNEGFPMRKGWTGTDFIPLPDRG
jgi:NADH-quinone oxidoreductase subunit C